MVLYNRTIALESMVLLLTIGIAGMVFRWFSMVFNGSKSLVKQWNGDDPSIRLGPKLNIKLKEQRLEAELILDVRKIYHGFMLCPNWICAQLVM